MADTDKESAETSGGLTVSEAQEMFERYRSFWSDNYNEANIDLKMAAGDPATHWGDAYAERIKNKQITMVINELPQFIHQVTNDIRQNTPSVSTIPDSDGDIETAEVYSDLIRDIEYKSSADEAYDTGAEYAVKCSLGFIRVDHDYCDDDSDEQELQIKKVPDPLSVWIDPASVECDGRDANGAIALEPINRKDFERLYPGKAFSSFTDPKDDASKKDSIVLGEVFIREFTGKRGKTVIVRRYKFSGDERLAETTFPGDYVPIVPVIGEDVWIEGKRILASLIRQARDPSLRLNHWACKEQQILNMAPIAPVMAARGTLVNDRGQWQSPGTETVLEYDLEDVDGKPAPPPTRLQPPPVPIGIINAMEGAKQNIKESLGMYNASIGEKSNETSGVAIQRRQHEGDVATFHFPDNVRRSITQVGRILASAIPIIYDTARVVQTMSNENEPKMVGINGAPVQKGQKQAHDLTKGKYRVRVTTGSSYTTKRQEAAALFGDVIKGNPELLKVIGDLWATNLDVAGAQAMAARFKKLIPPQLQDDQQDPQVIQLTQQLQQAQQIIQQGSQELQQLQAQLQSKQADDEAKLMTAKAKVAEVEVKKGELNLKFLQAANDTGQTNEAVTTQPEDEPVEVMQAKVQSKINARQQADMMAQQQAEQQAMADQQRMAIETEELRLKQLEIQQREQQASALIGTLGGIVQRLDMLAVQSSQPITVIRDENGAIVGAH